MHHPRGSCLPSRGRLLPREHTDGCMSFSSLNIVVMRTCSFVFRSSLLLSSSFFEGSTMATHFISQLTHAMHSMQNDVLFNARWRSRRRMPMPLQCPGNANSTCRINQNMPNLFFTFSPSGGGPTLSALLLAVSFFPFFSAATVSGSAPVAAARMAAIPI
jgi:hypothetical protein